MNHSPYSSTSSAPIQHNTAYRVLSALENYSLKQEKPNRYRCNSPLRPGSNSHAFTLIIDDEEHGAFFDHVSEQSGTLYDLAQQLGIDLPPLPSRQSIATTKRAYSNLDEYAQAHGVDAEVFRAANWSDLTYQNRPALAFTTATGTRYRFLDGENPTYKSQAGYARCWYGLSRAVQLAQESGQPLVICNGEASTVVGQHFGVAACAVTGGEKKELPTHLLDELKAAYTGPVLVAFDCLDKGAEAAPLLAIQLNAAGFAARAVDLLLGKGGDVADFCRLHTSGTVAALGRLPALSPAVSNAIPTTGVGSGSKSDLLNFAQVAAGGTPLKSSAFTPAPAQRWQWLHADCLDTLPAVRWLIPDEIPEQALVVLFGASGAGKSFVALDYSLQIAQQHPVLYIAAEGHAGYANRKIAWCKHHGSGAGQLYFPETNTVIALLDERTVQDFIASVTPLRPKFIVFDTLAWCMTGGDENSTGDMQRLITHCRQIQTATGASVLLVHHTGKSGASERGSSALRGGADMMIEMTNDDDVITLSCSKSKETEGFEDRYLARLTIETRPGETSCVWIPTEKVVHTKTDRLTRQQQEVLETLAAPLFIEVGARFVQLSDVLPDISRSGLYKTLNRLMDTRLGYITQGSRGEPFTITEAGKAALARMTGATPTNTASTESTPNLLESTTPPALRPLSTASTHASACRPPAQETLDENSETAPHATEAAIAPSRLSGQAIRTEGTITLIPAVLTPPGATRTPAPLAAAPEPRDIASTPTNAIAPTHSPAPLSPVNDTDRITLTALALPARGCPREFLPVSRVLPALDEAQRSSLQWLHTGGYIERQPSTYRLTDAGWAALGMRVREIDLSKF